MSALAMQSFGFGEQLVRVIKRDDIAWFIANDVCKALEIANPRHAVARLDDDEKGVVSNDTLGGQQDLTIISESGVFSLIFTSRKASAKSFRKWVTSDVLPTLRRTGSYVMPVPDNDDEDPLDRALAADASPDEHQSTLLRLSLVREARMTFGRQAARKCWAKVGLPDLTEQVLDRAPVVLSHNGSRVAEWLSERTQVADGNRISSSLLYRDFEAWCSDNGREAISQTGWGRGMTALGYPAYKSGHTYRIGLALID